MNNVINKFNGDWDDYHLFHRQQRHQRLYASPFPTQNSLETLALELHTSTLSQPEEVDVPERISAQSLGEPNSYVVKDAAHVTVLDYYALPLVV